MIMKVCVQCNIEKNESQFNFNGRDGYRNVRCKICQSENRNKLKEPEVVERDITLKTCKVCNIERTTKYFWRNPQYKDGFDSRCKICRNSGRKQDKKNTRPLTTPKHLQTFEQMVNLRAVTKQDFIEMWEFLEKIGYDVRSGKSVHEQFVDKWNKLTNGKMEYKKKGCHTTSKYLYDGSLNPEYIKYKKNLK